MTTNSETKAEPQAKAAWAKFEPHLQTGVRAALAAIAKAESRA